MVIFIPSVNVLGWAGKVTMDSTPTDVKKSSDSAATDQRSRGDTKHDPEMISSRFELASPLSLGEIHQQVEKDGTIRHLSATRESWKFCVVFSGFGAASDLFDYFLDQNVDFDVHWMRQATGETVTTDRQDQETHENINVTGSESPSREKQLDTDPGRKTGSKTGSATQDPSNDRRAQPD